MGSSNAKELESERFQNLLLKRQLEAANAQLAVYRNKGSRTRVNSDNNARFATAADIHEARQREEAKRGRRERASRVHRETAGDSWFFCLEWIYRTLFTY